MLSTHDVSGAVKLRVSNTPKPIIKYNYHTVKFTSVCPSIASIIVNDDQQDATILVYLFIPNQLYMFRAMSSLIIRST